MGVFSENAQEFWDAGLPAIPLWEGQKRPAINEWTQFCSRMPTASEQALWLDLHDGGNIGLPLGPESGLVAFDVDTVDADLLDIIDELTPVKSPWRRVGAKGYIAVYQYEGQKTFQIKGLDGGVICELLANGRQMVLPPSIHPDTGRAYVENIRLIDAVAAGIPRLPPDFEKALRASLGRKGVKLSTSGYSKVTDWVPRSARDNKYASNCGIWAREVVMGRTTLREALNWAIAWPEGFTEQVEGDNLDPQKGVQHVVKFLISDVRDKEMILRKGWDDGFTAEELRDLGLDFSLDEQEWTYQAIIDTMRWDLGELEKGGTDDEKMNIIHTVLGRLKRSPSLSVLQEESIFRAIQVETRTRMTIPTLRKELNKLRNQGLTGDSHADIAKHMVKDLGEGAVKFWSSQYWSWGGSHWVEKSPVELMNTIIHRYGSMTLCKRNGDYKAVLETFKTLVDSDLGDGGDSGLGVNFANGFLGVDGVLREHSRAFGTTYSLPYRYLPELELEKDAPMFSQFLRDAWGDDADYEDKVRFLRQAICATLFGYATKMSRAILLYGLAHSGKSVLLKIMEGLIPSDRISAIGPEMWGDKFGPAMLMGKLLNVGGELSERKKIDGAAFKQIIVGETMNAQFKNQPLFKFNPICAHWFASNHLPQSDDMSDGFLRRWGILKFNKKFPEDKRNVMLAEEIVAGEREAIVAWAVGVVGRLIDSPSYTMPPSHEEEVRKLLAALDSVYFFLQAGSKIKVTPCLGIVGPAGSSKLTTISPHPVFAEYQTFTAMTGARPVSFFKFLSRMSEIAPMMGFKEIVETSENGSPDRGYAGLTLIDARRGTGVR